MHYLDPRLDRAHVAVCYRNFLAKEPHFCHVGLGVNALHTTRMLRRHRIRADVVGVWQPHDVANMLAETPSVTHCLIEALWIGTANLAALLRDYPRVHFLVRAHSEVGFLQVEPGAISLLREQMLLAEQELNLTIAANSRRLTDFLRSTYDAHVLYLPNLYDRAPRRKGEPDDLTSCNHSSSSSGSVPDAEGGRERRRGMDRRPARAERPEMLATTRRVSGAFRGELPQVPW
jgi:hypothetical protein